MKIKEQQSELQKVFKIVKGGIATSSSMPILSGIYMSYDTVLATDLEIGIKTNYDADVIEKGAIVFPQNIISIINELPKQEVTIEVDENYEATITCGNSEFNLKGFDPEEFPQFPTVEDSETIQVNSFELESAIKCTEFATADDESQPALTGILFEKNYCTATNTYRMSNFNTSFNLENKLILPGDTAKEVKKKCKDVDKVDIEYSNNYIKFIFEDTTLVSRLIEGQFPNWQQVLPDEEDIDCRIKANRDKLLKALKRANIVAREEKGVITLISEKSRLKMESNVESSNVHEEIEVEKEGNDMRISLDCNYLLDVLKVLNEEKVEIKLINKLNPLMIEENNLKYIVMPMREE